MKDSIRTFIATQSFIILLYFWFSAVFSKLVSKIAAVLVFKAMELIKRFVGIEKLKLLQPVPTLPTNNSLDCLRYWPKIGFVEHTHSNERRESK